MIVDWTHRNYIDYTIAEYPYRPVGVQTEYILGVGRGVLVVVGAEAATIGSRIVSPAPGVYQMLGDSADTLIGRVVTPFPGVYVVSGNAADVLGNRHVMSDMGLYVIRGSDAGTLGHRILSPVSGVYVITGFDAVFPLTFAAYDLLAGRGTHSVVGTQASGELHLLTFPEGAEVLIMSTSGKLLRRITNKIYLDL